MNAKRKSESEPTQSSDLFPIVGIGASAGGLEAFTQLLRHLPTDTGMGFVLVQHLDPVHESALTKLLSKASSMPVSEVTNNVRVEANHVYVIPPNTTLSIAGGLLKLQQRKKARTPARSIDSFLESLAQDQRERAIGVILSGTATDGTIGLEAIKAEGGITFAQDDSAKYDSMPRSAVAAGCVDLVLSPAEIAKELARIAKHPYVAGQRLELGTPEEDRAEATAHEDDDTPLPSGGHGSPRTGARRALSESKEKKGEEEVGPGEDRFKKIVQLLRSHSGVDFSLYKSNTIQRRITRRVVLNKQDSLEDYADFLRGNTKELDALYSDTLISVTSFFRNPEAFEVLKRKVFPRLLERRGDEPFRIWVLGCSTGQEAYSLAMAFVEAAETAQRMHKLQVFATDLNDVLLDKARHGLYAKSLAEDVSPERLRRFFVEEEGGYRIVKSLREMVVFARQNLISDPPFSRLDLISCRNLLIYLEPDLQKKLVPVFHYALKPQGFLFLGASESVGGFTDLFGPVDKKQKIYSRKAGPTPHFQLPVRKERGETSPNLPPRIPFPQGKVTEELLPQMRGELNAQREADRLTVNRFAPPGALINDEMQILQFRGPVNSYLQPPSGKATFDVLKMAREGLMLPLRSAINKAKKDNQIARRENVRVDQEGIERVVNIEVIPLKNLRERCFLILFEDAESAPRVPRPTAEPDLKTTRRRNRKEESDRLSELERELAETLDYLQSIQEQHEATNEELQASNEEVQSANEELQSINEELETSKEELESANEELTTVNDEMAHRNAELNQANSDLVNFQASTKIAILLLGRDLTVRRFSAQAEKQFNVLNTDIGRPVRNIRHDLELSDLEDFIGDVIANVHEREREVRDKNGRWYSLRVRPYITLDNEVDGAVLVLLDIDALKRALEYAEAIIRTVREPLLVLDENLRVRTANRSFYEEFQVSPAETENRFIYDLGNRQWAIPKLRTALEEILPESNEFQNFEVEHDFESIGHRTMLLNARRLAQQSNGAHLILLAIEDVTQRRLRTEALRKWEYIFNHAGWAVAASNPETDLLELVNPAFARMHGYTVPELIGRSLADTLAPESKAEFATHVRRAHEEGDYVYESIHVSKDGTKFPVLTHVTALKDPSGRVLYRAATFQDISDRKQAEEALQQGHADLQQHAEELGRFNKAAVGRELRMIELKKEINELCRRHGESERYELEFEQDGNGLEE